MAKRRAEVELEAFRRLVCDEDSEVWDDERKTGTRKRERAGRMTMRIMRAWWTSRFRKNLALSVALGRRHGFPRELVRLVQQYAAPQDWRQVREEIVVTDPLSPYHGFRTAVAPPGYRGCHPHGTRVQIPNDSVIYVQEDCFSFVRRLPSLPWDFTCLPHPSEQTFGLTSFDSPTVQSFEAFLNGIRRCTGCWRYHEGHPPGETWTCAWCAEAT